MIRAEPIKIKIPPRKNQTLGVILNKIILNRTTKNGYAISMTDADEAPICLMAEKIKKLAKVAKSKDSKIKAKFCWPEPSNVFTPSRLKKTSGKTMTAVTIEFIKSRAIGETFVRIFWSIV